MPTVTVTLTDEEAFDIQRVLNGWLAPDNELAKLWVRARCGISHAPVKALPPPEPDVLWFHHSQSFYYKPVSAAGHEKFDSFYESTAFPGFYGFMEHSPDKFNDYSLTFLEVLAPAPALLPPVADVVWFRKEDRAFYKPMSEAGHVYFDRFVKGEYPGYYGFFSGPILFSDSGLTFLEIPPPAPTTYPIDPDCYLPSGVDVVWFKAGRGNYQFKPVSEAAQIYFRYYYKESPDYPGYYRFGSDTLIRLNPALTFAEEPAP